MNERKIFIGFILAALLIIAVTVLGIFTILSLQQNIEMLRISIILIAVAGLTGASIILALGSHITKRERLVDQYREQLIRVASHQLRTPATIISGHAELLLDSDISPDNKILINTIKDTAENMSALIQDILNVATIEQGRFVVEKKPADVAVILKNIISEVEMLAKEYLVNIRFSQKTDFAPVLTDKLKIKQAFYNIIINGIKYGKRGGELEVKLYAKERKVIITISDEGIGISKPDQKMIFQQFYRASNAKNKIELGTGLGLFIASEIIKQSGGKIGFISEEGKGTSFYVELPLMAQ